MLIAVQLDNQRVCSFGFCSSQSKFKRSEKIDSVKYHSKLIV